MKRIRNNQSLIKLFKYSTTFLIFGLVIIAASQYAPNTKAISTPTSGSCGTWGSFYRQDGGSLSHQTQYVCKSNGTTWRFYRLAPIYAGNSNMLYRKISRGVIGSESNNRTLEILVTPNVVAQMAHGFLGKKACTNLAAVIIT